MATVELTLENFDDVVSGPGTVLVDFWAAWCGPCRRFAPVFERASELYAQPEGLPAAALEQLITRVARVDMDEVRASLEKSA